jgi:hypothetical protein
MAQELAHFADAEALGLHDLVLVDDGNRDAGTPV